MASAEERQLGVSEWQLLLPMPAPLQWIVKAAVTLGLTGVLVLGLPAVLGLVDGSSRLVHEAETAALVIGAVVMLSTFSLYVSSLCSSGVGALVFTIPAAIGGMLFVWNASWLLNELAETVWQRLPLPRLGPEPFVIPLAVLLLVAPILLAAFLLWLASVNHRSADHRGGRVWKRAIAIGGFVTAALLVLAVFVAASRA